MTVTKYGNIPATYRGETYDSRAEVAYAQHLERLQAAGQIRSWRRGRVWTLVDGPRRADRITYTPDFEVEGPDGALRCVDVKGVETDVFKLKARLWRAVYPGIPLEVVRAGRR